MYAIVCFQFLTVAACFRGEGGGSEVNGPSTNPSISMNTLHVALQNTPQNGARMSGLLKVNFGPIFGMHHIASVYA